MLARSAATRLFTLARPIIARPLIARTMASHATSSATPIAAVTSAMHRIAPLSLAESWDNVGVLLEAPTPRPSARGVHLCIDLTTSVCEEALSDSNVGVILCYHPVIFRGLKSLRLADSQQRSLLRCAAAGISIYSPHTSLDAVPDGINDWLAASCAGEGGFASRPRACQPSKQTSIPADFSYDSSAAIGMGRSFKLAEPIALDALVQRLKKALGVPHLQIATPSNTPASISSIAVCAGSGSSVLEGDDSDCWLTGEMSHHAILAANAAGRTVILANHTNTERGYLRSVLKGRLEKEDPNLIVTVSESDRDPLSVV